MASWVQRVHCLWSIHHKPRGGRSEFCADSGIFCVKWVHLTPKTNRKEEPQPCFPVLRFERDREKETERKRQRDRERERERECVCVCACVCAFPSVSRLLPFSPFSLSNTHTHTHTLVQVRQSSRAVVRAVRFSSTSLPKVRQAKQSTPFSCCPVLLPSHTHHTT